VLNWQRKKTTVRTKRWTPPKVPVKALLPRTQRNLLKLTQSQPNKIFDIDDEGNGPPGPEELDLQRGFDRPKIVHHEVDDEPLSDYITIRLAIIRAKALQKYKEVCYNKNSQA
jgi:hypothetical protein